MINMIVRAMHLAYEAHEGQYRRGDGEPYINHPKRVVRLLGDLLPNPTSEMYAAAWLHDTLEDTTLSEDTILQSTNKLTLDYVKLLTCRKCTNNKEYNTEFYLQTLSTAPSEVQNIKLCDMLDNMADLAGMDDEEWAIKSVMKRDRAIWFLTEADTELFRTVRTRINVLKELFNLK